MNRKELAEKIVAAVDKKDAGRISDAAILALLKDNGLKLGQKYMESIGTREYKGQNAKALQDGRRSAGGSWSFIARKMMHRHQIDVFNEILASGLAVKFSPQNDDILYAFASGELGTGDAKAEIATLAAHYKGPLDAKDCCEFMFNLTPDPWRVFRFEKNITLLSVSLGLGQQPIIRKYCCHSYGGDKDLHSAWIPVIGELMEMFPDVYDYFKKNPYDVPFNLNEVMFVYSYTIKHTDDKI